MNRCWLAALMLSWPLLSFSAKAQLVPEAGDNTPVEILADEALEWRREEKAYIARGNAVANRGDMTVSADTLTAYYREGQTGGTEIWQVKADGNVRIKTPTQTATGEQGLYDIDQQLLKLTGNNLRLETETDVVTAKDSLEYWSAQQQAVARGDATATREQNTLRADMLTASFAEDAKGDLQLKRIDADGDILITTPQEVLRGSKGVYDVGRQMATLNGNVRITRGENQLNGDAAEVNLATGVSRMLASPGGSGTGGRVRGLFIPGQEPKLNKNGTKP